MSAIYYHCAVCGASYELVDGLIPAHNRMVADAVAMVPCPGAGQLSREDAVAEKVTGTFNREVGPAKPAKPAKPAVPAAATQPKDDTDAWDESLENPK